MNRTAILGMLALCFMLFAGCSNRDAEVYEERVEKDSSEAEDVETEFAMVAETVIEECSETEEIEPDTIEEVDYLELARACEKEFKVVNGEEYNCDVAIDLRGCAYIFEFPEENIAADMCKLFFDYENAEVEDATEGKKVEVPVLIVVDGVKYYVGLEHIYWKIQSETDGFELKEISFCYDGNDEYRGVIDYNALKNGAKKVSSTIIRKYNKEERTIELCYVTPVEKDTYMEYEIEKEEWVTLPLDEDAKIVSWSLSNTSASYISEDLFFDRVEWWLEHNYFFATVYEDEGSIKGIVEILNP